MSAKLVFGATDRNKGPILDVLQKVLQEKFGNSIVSTLEIASGTGQHAVFFSDKLKNLKWQPSDINQRYINSITDYVKDSKLLNVKFPAIIDITNDPSEWKDQINPPYKMLIAINLIHISPWKCTEGLFKAAGLLLEPKGILVTYGPYSIDGSITPESNVRFNEGLKMENPEWGLRDIEDLKQEAQGNGLYLDAMFDMPSNNKTLIWLKQ